MTRSFNDGRLLLHREGEVATLTFNAPDRLNSIDTAMARALDEASAQLGDESPAVIVLRGNGRAFCAGGDIQYFVRHLDSIEGRVSELLDHLHRFIVRLRAGPAIVLTSVHGSVAGAGVSLAFMGDLCIAAEDARFVAAYANLGVTPDAGGSIGLVERLGARRALQFFLIDQSMSCREAEAMGLVARAVPADRLVEETDSLARALASLGRDVLAGTRALVAHSPEATASSLERERLALLQCMKTDRFRARALAFATAKSSSAS